MKSENLPPAKAQAQPADDFAKNITGIGPTTEARLHDAGIRTFAQLADRTHSELYELVRDLPGMSLERLTNWDWPGHARELASKALAEEVPSNTANSGNRQRYANFHVELLLDEEDNVRRTRVRHVEAKEGAKSWTGWDGHRLLSFIHGATVQPASEEKAIKPKPLTTPKLEITKAEVHTDAGPVASGIVPLDQAWSMHVEWILSDATSDMLTGKWMVRAHLESIGPGDEYALPAVGPVRVPLSAYVESSNGEQPYRYVHQLKVAVGGVGTGTYELAVAVTWQKEDGTPGELASFFNGTVQIYTRT